MIENIPALPRKTQLFASLTEEEIQARLTKHIVEKHHKFVREAIP